MNTVKTWQTDSTSSEHTERLAERLGKNLRGGEVIELVSDLGGGKTTFVRGLARGIGSDDKVASPTFTVSKLYKTEKFELHHFDFYRLQEAGLIAHELHDLLADPTVVIVVEWADIVADVLPADRLTISISKLDDHSRSLMFSYPESYQYCLEDLG